MSIVVTRYATLWNYLLYASWKLQSFLQKVKSWRIYFFEIVQIIVRIKGWKSIKRWNWKILQIFESFPNSKIIDTFQKGIFQILHTRAPLSIHGYCSYCLETQRRSHDYTYQKAFNSVFFSAPFQFLAFIFLKNYCFRNLSTS